MNLRIVAETSTTITIGWDPVAGQQGYVTTLDGGEAMVDGKRHGSLSKTATQVRIGKPQDGKPHSYGVKILGVSTEAAVTSPAPPPQVTRPFTASSAFNKPIPPNAPVHPDSGRMLSPQTWWLVNGLVHDGIDLSPFKEWLGPRDRAFYWKGDVSQLPRKTVSVNYSDASGYGCGKYAPQVPMPTEWEPLFAGGSFDGIIWVVDAASGDSWESYRLTPPGTASKEIQCDPSKWNAVRLDFFRGEEVAGVGYGYGYGQSGSDILTGAGLLRPEDFFDLSPVAIPHALRGNWNCGSSGANYPVGVGPAGTGDGQQTFGIPMGARVRLKTSVDVVNDPVVAAKPRPWRDALIKIGLTLQQWGIVGVDTSGTPGAGGIEAADHRYWQKGTCPWAGISDYQRGIPYSWMQQFEVIDWRQWTGA